MSHTGEEFENPVSGERSVVRLGSDDTDGQSVLADLYLRPGGGPNEHVHSYLHETFEVLGGRVGFRLDGREEITGPGRKLEVPPGVVHDFWNAGDQEAHVLVRVAPRPLLRLAVFAKEFEQEIQLVSPPRWLQRLLFLVLAPVGRARGYRAIDPRYAELVRRTPAAGAWYAFDHGAIRWSRWSMPAARRGRPGESWARSCATCSWPTGASPSG